MSNNPFAKRNATRNLDKESGKNRVQHRNTKDEIEDETMNEDELFEFKETNIEDDSTRPATTVKRVNDRAPPQQEKDKAQEATSQDIEKTKSHTPQFGSSGALLLQAMARHAIPAPITTEKTNEIIPDAGNFMEAVYQMSHLLTDNQKLYELVPDYSSIALNLYYSHVYYYQVLRARDEVGCLTRLQRRSLRVYNTIGKPESWPIATPLTGFIQALGATEIPDKMFSHIAPKLPDIAKFTASSCLKNLKDVDGAGIVPIIPAYHQFLRLYGHKKAHYDDDESIYYPTEQELRADNSFLKLTASKRTDLDFQTLALNNAWNQSMETEEPIGVISRGGIQQRIKRWNIPLISDDTDFKQLENFLFADTEDLSWFRHLIKMAGRVNYFFPGSGNLSQIPALTTVETFTAMKYKARTARTLRDDHWYYTRKGWSFSYNAKYYGKTSNELLIMAAATSVHTEYDATIIPRALTSPFECKATGPYFKTETGDEPLVPINQSDCLNKVDPTNNLIEYIEKLFDNNPSN
nr:capsid protein [Sarcosphaera coronaria partitivirus]